MFIRLIERLMRQRGDGQTDQTLVYGEPDKPSDRNEGADEQIRGKNRLILRGKKKKKNIVL